MCPFQDHHRGMLDKYKDKEEKSALLFLLTQPFSLVVLEMAFLIPIGPDLAPFPITSIDSDWLTLLA